MITDRQFGFVKNSNTKSAMMDFVNTTVRTLNQSSKCLALILDLTKAFDTGNHELLIEKSNNYGIQGTALELINNYLVGRIQLVEMKQILISQC